MNLHIRVKPGSTIDQLFYDDAGQLNAKIKAPAQDGKANTYLVEFLAKQFGMAKSKVTIVAGFTNPHKRLEVEADAETIKSILERLQT